jgi:DNA-directed RNA polymerase beta subunit/DNA-directed RNA polymerase beta' subunit
MAEHSPRSAFDALKNNVVGQISSYFPFKGRLRTLKLDKVWVDDKVSVDDIRSQVAAKDNERTWGVPVKAVVSLVDNRTGKVIDRSTKTLAVLPKVTPRYGFIVNGTEYQVDNLLRLKAGVYARVQQNGDLQAEFNLRNNPKKGNFSLHLDKESKQFSLLYRNAHVPLYPILRSMGVRDEDLEKEWGKELLEANRPKTPKAYVRALTDFHKRFGDPNAPTPGSIEEYGAVVRDYFSKPELLPDTTQRTLGKPFTKVTGEVLRRATGKILNIHRGKEEPDDRDSLVFKEVWSIEDFLPEKLQREAAAIKARLRSTVDYKKNVSEIVTSKLFHEPIREFFTQGGSIAECSKQTNPLHMLSSSRKTTLMSEGFGGIKSGHSITDEMRAINPSSFGFLDPAATPESERTGISLQISRGVRKKGQDLEAPAYNIKAGKLQYLKVPDFHDAYVVLPDQVRWKGGKPVPVAASVKMKAPGGAIEIRPFKDAQYVMPSAKAAFCEASNLVPFMPSDQGNRLSMAYRQMIQAIGLKDPEAPLVQSRTDSANPTHTFEKQFGAFASHRSPVAGKVIAVKPDAIVVSDGKKRTEVQIYNHFPLNDAKSEMHARPLVRVGDKVEKGQVLADTNFTDRGVLALGKNMRVGFLPYRGYNFEDGVVISESAAKKLTSSHLHQTVLELDPDSDVLGKDPWMRYSALKANSLTKEQLATLGSDGVIKPGTRVEPGQVLVAALGKPTDNRKLQALRRVGFRAVKPYKDKSLVWDKDYVGEVVRVVKSPNGKSVKVYVRTEEPMQVGDKLSGRHGNKGVVSKVLPDHEMPYTLDKKTGERKPLEVLLNPSGVPSRMNVGQVWETTAGKIAEKTGKPYIINNFGTANPNYMKQVESDLKKHGISAEEEVYDPKYPKRPMKSVLVGPQYLLKMQQQVEEKISARGAGIDLAGKPLPYDIDKQPAKGGSRGGQGFGALDMYALLNHNARANIREMATIKGDQQEMDKFWNFVQQGYEPPPPRVPFAYEKFEALLKGAGINVHKEGTHVRLAPLTDREALALAGGKKGELKRPHLLLTAKNLKPEVGGLYDPRVTGGHDGSGWAVIRIAKPMPNPIFVGEGNRPGPVPELLNLQVKDIDQIMVGKKTLNGKSGGAAILDALKQVNVDEEIKKIQARLPSQTGNALNRDNRKLKYLKALKQANLKPHEAYVVNYLPVIPPKFRPTFEAGPGGQLLGASINGLYKNFAIINNKLKEFDPKKHPESMSSDLHSQLWDSFKALQSVGSFKNVYESAGKKQRELKGILHTLSGDQPKTGMIQARLIKRRQDLSMRSTIIPEPQLHLDEVGLPRNAAMEMYKHFVVAKLHSWGVPPLEGQEKARQMDEMARRALDEVVKERPILLKRDPVLHRFSVMAFRPRIVGGKSIQIHPLVCGGFNADFDGDQQLGSVFVSISEELDTFLSRLARGSEECDARVCAKWTHQSWWDQRRVEASMAARLRTMVGAVSGGDLFLLNLEDFPHEGDPIVKDHIEFYAVPPGIQVVAYDETYGRAVLANVSHWSRHRDRNVEIVNLASGRQIVTDDDPRAVYGLDASLNFIRARPKDAIGLFVPTMHTLDLGKDSIETIQAPAGDPRMRQEVILSTSFGRLLGTLVGDGWAVHSNGQAKGQVCLAAVDDSIREGFEEDLRSVFTTPPTLSRVERAGGDFGDDVRSCKYIVSSMAFQKLVEPLIGCGAESKHLPPFFLQASREFRVGLLAGLVDTDGSISISHGKGKPQWLISFSTKSVRLAQELTYLARSLAIGATITPCKTPKGDQMWAVGFSTVDFHKLGWLPVASKRKKELFSEFFKGPAPEEKNSYSQKDIIPTPKELAKFLRKQLSPAGPHRNLYMVLSGILAKDDRQYISRYSARKILEALPSLRELPYTARWAGLVDNEHIRWDRVVSYEKTDVFETGYDLTAPGFETFMSADGIILSNTMAATVPVTAEAVEEAKNMFPSKHLFSHTNYGPMYLPDHEALLGLYKASKWGSKKSKSFANPLEADRAYARGEIDMTDVVKIGGKETTLGRAKLADRLPKTFALRNSILYDPRFIWDKGTLSKKIGTELARKHQSDYTRCIDQIKDFGNEYVYMSGTSLTLKDFKPLSGRDKLFAQAHKVVDKIRKSTKNREEADSKAIDVYHQVGEKIDAKLRATLPHTDSRLVEMVLSGARGSPLQLRQMVAAPVLMVDAKDRVVPVPVTKSYAEGLDFGEYWITQHGARKGTAQKTRGTSEPGEMSKSIINVTMGTTIQSKDCGTNQGVHLPLDHPDVTDRFLATNYKLRDGSVIKSGQVVTPDVLNRMKNSGISKILVRSPLKCSHGTGICAKCAGLSEKGKLHPEGTNIGVIAGQSMGEPIVQLSMSMFHTGGVAEEKGAKPVDRFGRLKNLLKLPKVTKDQATIAKVPGTVTAVRPDPTGGWDVFIGKEKHVVPAKAGLLVKPGEAVRAGQALSGGDVNPIEFLKATGDIDRVQHMLVSEIGDKVYQGKVKHRHIETVVRNLTNIAQIRDPGDTGHWDPGDVVPRSAVEEHNKKLPKGLKPARYTPVLAGMEQAALLGSKDWMARLNYRRLHETIQQAAQQGLASDLHGPHPVPGLIFGKEFGKPPAGNPKHHY